VFVAGVEANLPTYLPTSPGSRSCRWVATVRSAELSVGQRETLKTLTGLRTAESVLSVHEVGASVLCGEEMRTNELRVGSTMLYLGKLALMGINL
jgi:hypothetical protein